MGLTVLLLCWCHGGAVCLHHRRCFGWQRQGFSKFGVVRMATGPDVARPSDSYDVIVVGSGIGGLSCAAMLALYGNKVAVFESHYRAGGAAHGYTVKDREGRAFHFDTGPSFFSGLNPDIPGKPSNPLRTILDAIGERVECIPYETFGLLFPEGDFVHSSDFGQPGGALEQAAASSAATKQWQTLMRNMKPLEAAVDALPTAALRSDPGVLLSVLPFLSKFLTTTNPVENLKLTRPFGTILDEAGIRNGCFARNWIDLLCFCLSGLPADGTITAEMAMMMGEFYDANAVMDCPKAGAYAIVEALVRGLEKHGGSLFLNSPVQSIEIRDGRATGVTLRNKQFVAATQAVVSNLSIWDLLKSGIVDTSQFPKRFVEQRLQTPVGRSFLHMHVAFSASPDELKELQAHYIYMDDWSRGVEAQDNAVLVSIPSVHDSTLAPVGFGVLHIYTPATEDYDQWRDMDRRSREYKELKTERSQYLWKVLERILPDIRKRAHIVNIGTPLTHERFLRRYRGSYGPAIRDGSFPFPKTPVDRLLLCGDSCFPGIGVPAVAGSGLIAANSVSWRSLRPQLEMLLQHPK